MDDVTRLTAALAERYQIDREIGQGGMATVFLARDVRHDRRVALKVLKPELGAVLGVERFLSEIRVTANLQHPNLLPLFDSGEANGLLFYVMPYVEGESLRARLEREKQFSIDEAVRIASGVAAALDYAHRNGVIHRDLKPENILLQDGQPVIADFGIALAVSKAGGNRITQTGLSLGTPQYMSPEQATGDRVIDGRTDIYSLGAVTYEMLVGDPPHLGGTSQNIISKLLTEKPRSIRATRENVPLHVEAAIEHALAKLPADRFATAHEFSEALHGRGTVAVAAVGAAPRSTRSRTMRVAAQALSLSLAAAAGALLWKWLGPTAPPSIRPMARFDIHFAHDDEPITPVGTTGSRIAFSPDGARIAYVGRSKSEYQVYTRSLDQVDPAPIAGSEGGQLPFFSPNGQWLGFKQGQRIVKVALAGGPVTTVCDVVGRVFGATWTAGDMIVFASDSGLEEVPAAGGRAHLFAKSDSGEKFRWPEALPDDHAILFSVFAHGDPHLAAAIRATGEVRRLEQIGASPQFVDGGFVVFSTPGMNESGSISAVPFDVKRLDISGTPVLIAENMIVGPQGGRDVGVSRSGAIAYFASVAGSSRLVLVNRKGVARDAGLDTGGYSDPSLSPEGKRVVLNRRVHGHGNLTDVWVFDLSQQTRTRVTHDSAAETPIWTRDGKRIAYTRWRSANFAGDIYTIPVDGSGAPEPLVIARGVSWPAAFLPDGSMLYIGWASPRSKGGIWQIGVGAGAKPRTVLVNAFENGQPSPSPDGKWLAYTSDETGRLEVYVQPFPGPGGRWAVSLDGGTAPIWSPMGNEIFYRNGPQMMTAAVRTTPTFEVGVRTQLFSGVYDAGRFSPDYDVARDGQMFVMLQPVSAEERSVVVMLNWFDKLRGKQ